MGPVSLLPILLFTSVCAVALFSFISIATWAGERRRERESFYRNDMLKKVAESQNAGASSALEVLREEQRYADLQRRQGLRIGGLVTIAVGAGVMIFLYALIPGPIYLCGLIPLLVGVALGAASFLPSPKV